LRLAHHLWLRVGPAPFELVTYTLCSEVYHCRPSELKEELLSDVLAHLTVRSEIARYKEMEAKGQQWRRGPSK
jgi:hypothetical protein